MTAKDSTWAWLVSVGAFVTYFLETGVIKSLGVMLPVLRQQFTTQTWVIGLIISLVPGFGAVSCILASTLHKRFSARTIMMVYAILSSAGLITASLAPTVTILALSLTLVGFALGCESVVTSSLPDYFDKYYDTANGIAHAGLSAGVMVMPLLTQFSLDLYGWRGTMLLVSAVNSYIVVCAALLRPQLNKGSMEIQDTNENRPVDVTEDNQAIEQRTWRMCISDILRDIPLVKNFDLTCLVIIFTGQGYFYTGWLIYLVPHSIDTGFEPYEASALATVGGVTNFAGTMIFPLAAKVLSGKSLLYLATLTASFGLAIDPMMTYISSYGGLAFATSVVNIGFAVADCAIFKQLLKVVEKDQFTNAVNWLFVGYGFGSILSGFWTGWLFDTFGDYTASYLFLSAVPVLSLGPMFVMDIIEYVLEKQYNMLPSTDSGHSSSDDG